MKTIDPNKNQTVFKEEEKEKEKADASEVKVESTKTGMGLEQNIAGLLCYAFGIISGLVFFFMEKENKFVRFHAIQSIAVTAALFIFYIVVTIVTTMLSFIIPFFGVLIGLLLFPLSFILWVLLMYKAYQGEWFKLPVVGDFAEKQVNN